MTDLLIDDLWTLYRQVLPMQEAFDREHSTIGAKVRIITNDKSPVVAHVLRDAAMAVYFSEPVMEPLQTPDQARDLTSYRSSLLRKYEFFTKGQEEDLAIAAAAPLIHCQLNGSFAPSPFKVKYSTFFGDNLGTAIDDLYRELARHCHKHQFLIALINRLGSNRYTASHKDLGPARESKLPPEEMVDTYLAGTPYQRLFNTLVPFSLPREKKFEHALVVAGSGAGKTTLLENLIMEAINDPAQPSVVVLDPHNRLSRKLVDHDYGIGDRLVYVTPRDIEHPPAINIFAMTARGDDAYTREQVENGVLQTFSYLFAGLDVQLTGKMETFFQYVARLMLSFPRVRGRNAVLTDLLELMTSKTQVEDVIATLAPAQRAFFDTDYTSGVYKDTKEQIRYRLRGLMGMSSMERMLNSPETKLDWYAELNRGSVIVVDTAQDFLAEQSPYFGRFMLSLIFRAIMERAALPEHELRDTFIFIDEAANVMDAKTADMLRAVRKYRCGITLSPQDLSKASSDLRAALSGSTSIKFAAKPAMTEIGFVASDLRTTKEFLLDLKPHHWACYVDGMTRSARDVTFSPALDHAPLSHAQRQAFMARNRQRVSLGTYPTAAPVEFPKAAEGDDMTFEKW